MRIDDVEIRDADIFATLLDSFPDMIHSINDDGRIVYTNQKAEALLGYSREELLGMNVRQIYADEILQAMESGFSDLKQRGDKTVESMLKSRSGQRIPVEIRSFSIYDDEGNFLRTFSILRDLREIKDLQQSLIHAGRLAAIGELASGVAHDINNPLTVILLSNEMGLRELSKAAATSTAPRAERLTALMNDIRKASQSIQKLADHLRTFSRGMAEAYEMIDLALVIQDALFIAKNKVEKSCHHVDNRLEEGLYFVLGCPNQLEQVFVNLIGNACDAIFGRQERVLTLAVEPSDLNGNPCWRLDVTDTGTGIRPEIMEEIFHSFFTTKEKGKGTGLGLSISRAIVRDHKGEIRVRSELEKGSTFSVYLPQAAAAQS